MSVEEAVKLLNGQGFSVETDGEGENVTSTVPIANTRTEKGDVVLLRT